MPTRRRFFTSAAFSARGSISSRRAPRRSGTCRPSSLSDGLRINEEVLRYMERRGLGAGGRYRRRRVWAPYGTSSELPWQSPDRLRDDWDRSATGPPCDYLLYIEANPSSVMFSAIASWGIST